MTDFTFNEVSVLHTLYSLESPTRTAISRECCMSLGVTSSVLDALLRKGAITKTGSDTPAIGRPSLVYGIDPRVGFALGVTVDAASVGIVAVDASKALIAEEVVAVNVMSAEPSAVDCARKHSPLVSNEQPVFIGNLIHLCDEFLAQKKLPVKSLLAIGLGLPGAVNPHTGVWIRGLRVAGIERVNIRASISKYYGVPVLVDDVARTIATYEKTLGLGRSPKDLVVLHLGEGVGAGAIVGGKLYQGHRGLSAEIGHLMVDPHGYRCICGNVGCLETIASIPGILRLFADRIREVGQPALAGHYFSNVGELSIASILEAARGGDGFTRSILFEIGLYLGDACTNLVFLYDPEQIIVSGTGALLGEYLIDAMRQSLAKRISASLYQDFDVLFSKYEPTHESHGAALLATSAYWDVAADGRR